MQTQTHTSTATNSNGNHRVQEAPVVLPTWESEEEKNTYLFNALFGQFKQ